MGYGDFKLLAAIGAWLGWKMLPVVILLSSFVGAVVGISLIVFARHGRNVPIPFGPYLAVAGLRGAVLWQRPQCSAISDLCSRTVLAYCIGVTGRHRLRQKQRRRNFS